MMPRDIPVAQVREWVLSACINAANGLNPDSRIAEVVYVVGRRVREITREWPFGECSEVREPYSADFYLSFKDELVDPKFGYGPLAYAYCRRYLTKDGEHR
jgi:hypothetical protein